MNREEFDSPFETLVIIEFSPECSPKIKNWLNLKLKNEANLLTKFSENSQNQVKIFYTKPQD